MDEVKRYITRGTVYKSALVAECCHHAMEESPIGDWNRHADYAALERELVVLRAPVTDEWMKEQQPDWGIEARDNAVRWLNALIASRATPPAEPPIDRMKTIEAKRAALIAAMAKEGLEPAPDYWTSERFAATPGHVLVNFAGVKITGQLTPLLEAGDMWYWFVPRTAEAEKGGSDASNS